MESTSEQRFRKSNNSGIRQITDKQLLSDAGLVTDNGDVTYAALVLLGKPGSVKNFLGLNIRKYPRKKAARFAFLVGLTDLILN